MNPEIKKEFDKIYIDINKMTYEEQYKLFDECLKMAILSTSINTWFEKDPFLRDMKFSPENTMKIYDEVMDNIHHNFFPDVDVKIIHPTREFTIENNINSADIIQFIYGINVHLFREKIRTSDKKFDSNIFTHNKDLMTYVIFTDVFDDECPSGSYTVFSLIKNRSDLLDKEFKEAVLDNTKNTLFDEDLSKLADYLKSI